MHAVVPCQKLYPWVFNMSIPIGYLLAGNEQTIIPCMDKYEIRRRHVLELIKNQCGGVHAKFAEKIERSPSYVGRMLYPDGKKGKKNISDTLIDVIEDRFALPRGWLDGISEDKELSSIMSIWSGLSDTQKALAADMLKAIARSASEKTLHDPLIRSEMTPLKESEIILKREKDR